MLTNVTSENFNEEVRDSNIPVIADFWAGWCAPCMMMGPVFEELSNDYEGKLKFAKINTEAEQELAGSMGIMGIPCLIVFDKGEEVDRIVGYAPKEVLKEKIDAILSKI